MHLGGFSYFLLLSQKELKDSEKSDYYTHAKGFSRPPPVSVHLPFGVSSFVDKSILLAFGRGVF